MVEKEFVENGKAIVRPGNLILFSKENAIEFIKKCQENSIEILGIDGFFLSEKFIQPSLENSIDFSSGSYVSSGNIYSEAINFINQKSDDLVFEIVCE